MRSLKGLEINFVHRKVKNHFMELEFKKKKIYNSLLKKHLKSRTSSMNKPNSQENGSLKSKNNKLTIEDMIASFTLNLMEWLIPRLKRVTYRREAITNS